MKSDLIIGADKKNIGVVLDYLKEALSNTKCNSREINKTMLSAEESMLKLFEYCSVNDECKVSVKSRLGKVITSLSVKGKEIDFDNEIAAPVTSTVFDLMDDWETGYAINRMLLKLNSDDIKYRNRNGVNYVDICAHSNEHSNITLTILALVLSIALGIMFRLVMPTEINLFLTNNIFEPIKSIYLNLMRAIVGPIVFFSIATCISGFESASTVGRIGKRLVILYTATSIAAIGLGLLLFNIFRPGDFGSINAVDATQAEGELPSFIESVKGFFPSNIVESFLQNNTIQIIVIAIAIGLTMMLIGQKAEPVRKLFDSFNEIFTVIVSALAKLIPLVVFCSTFSSVLTLDSKVLMTIMSLFVVVLIGFASCGVFYCIMILSVARLNPLVMLKKYATTALTVFSLSSSNASMPFNMEFCEKIGIPKKIAAFSIPLGATVNMDGGCVCYTIVALFFARVYGITPTPAQITVLLFTILLLTMGMPGIPGGAAVILTPTFAILGVPIEGIGLFLGVDAILDMFRTVNNTTGDVAGALVISKLERQLDEAKYYSK